MANDWGRPQKSSFPDLKMVALGLFIVGAIIYMLYPNIVSFFQGFNADQTATSALGDIVLPDDTTASSDSSSVSGDLSLPSVFEGLYQDTDIASGYWIIYVGDGELRQMQLTSGGYDFVMGVLEKDAQSQEEQGTLPILVATDGQLKKYLVSEQFYDIIDSLSDISGRAGSI